MLRVDFCRVGQRTRMPGWSAALLFSFLGCAAPTSLESREDVGVVREAVIGGADVEACEWPSTVSVNGWGSCSGTLIHPRIVTTAAHCIKGGSSMIYFGASRSTPGAFGVEARCEVGAEGSRGANTSRDWAYCVLPEDERVQQIPVTPPLVGCEADRYLKAGLDAWVVGFGTTSPLGGGAGSKRQVGVVVNALNKVAPGTIDVGDAEQGACHGDSGGPLYVHLMDGQHDWGYRVVGSTSGAGARGCDCNCSTVYVNIANHVKAIEEQEHIDVTPCTDQTGAFDPSPACTALMTSPQSGVGSFPSCMVARTSEPINSCGVLETLAAVVPHAAVGGSAGRAQSQAGTGGAVVPDITAAVNAASMPAAAFQPAAGSGSKTGSATFSISAAGGSALAQSTTEPSSSGCSLAAVGDKAARGWGWTVSCGLCLLGGARLRRRRWSRR